MTKALYLYMHGEVCMRKQTLVGRLFSCALVAASCWITNLSFGSAPNMVLAQDGGTQLPQQGDPIALYKQAGIDEKQQQQILALANAYEGAEDKKAHEVIGYIKQLRALSLNPDLDEKAILQTQSNISKLEAEMAMDKMRLLIDIRRVLNHDQRKRLVELIQKQRSNSGTASGAEGTSDH